MRGEVVAKSLQVLLIVVRTGHNISVRSFTNKSPPDKFACAVGAPRAPSTASKTEVEVSHLPLQCFDNFIAAANYLG